MSPAAGDEEPPDPVDDVDEVDDTLRDRGRVGRRTTRCAAGGQCGVLLPSEPPGLLVRLETALELAERTSSGWVEGLGKLLREERLMLWVGSCGVLGGEGRSK